jgi:light-regulated signal transduction histidine kinase (bacteriophytochrome)
MDKPQTAEETQTQRCDKLTAPSEVEGLLKQVESISKEFKDFVYIISHDLKAPLRAIKALTDWLAADYADKFDADGKEQLNLLTSRVNRMNNLLDGVLQYSRIGRVTENPVQIDTNQLMHEIIESSAPPANIHITIENQLPVITSERTRIQQVFQNLLGNAVRFMDKPEGFIKVGCTEENGFWKFSVSDNGPGIAEQHFEKIFKLFQTLQPKDQFESTGVGLTLVKKIVELYAGKVWLTSKLGEGATFFFTLPKSPAGDQAAACVAAAAKPVTGE